MRLFSLLLCFSLCLATTACENEGDFLPDVGTTDPGTTPPGTTDPGPDRPAGDPTQGAQGGEVTGTWNLVNATTNTTSKSTVSGFNTVAVQAGVLKQPSTYTWTISTNPNTITPNGELIMEVTTSNNGIDLGAVEVPGDVTLTAIREYERNGGLLIVSDPYQKKYNATILLLNDSIFNFNTEYAISIDQAGVKVEQSYNNTYYFKR